MITTYGGLQVLDSTGATVLSSGTSPTWNWTNITGTGIPQNNATVGATFDVNVTGQITPTNVSTYIASVAIKTAQIADLAVTTGKIQNLAVDTLQVAGNAITVPLAAYTAASIAANGGLLQSIAVPIISPTIITKLNVSFGATFWGQSIGQGGQPYGIDTRLYANGVLVYTGGWGITDTWTATANSATILYTLPANTAVTFTMYGDGSDYSCRFITVLTVKR